MTPTLAEVQTAKLTEVNAARTAAIEAGCDVPLSDGTAGHISLTIPDQINLSTVQGTVAASKTDYAYHLDGALCEVYPAADIAPSRRRRPRLMCCTIRPIATMSARGLSAARCKAVYADAARQEPG